MLMRPWKKSCAIKTCTSKSTVYFICLVNCDDIVACHLFLWTPKFIKVSKLMLLLHMSPTSYPVEITHMSTHLTRIEGNVVHTRGNYFNIPLFAESQGLVVNINWKEPNKKVTFLLSNFSVLGGSSPVPQTQTSCEVEAWTSQPLY